MYLGGTGISLNSLGFATKVGDSGVLGLSVTSMSFGDIPITTEDLPEGGIGSFSPAFSNIGVTYSKEFSNSIYGGLTKALTPPVKKKMAALKPEELPEFLRRLEDY